MGSPPTGIGGRTNTSTPFGTRTWGGRVGVESEGEGEGEGAGFAAQNTSTPVGTRTWGVGSGAGAVGGSGGAGVGEIYYCPGGARGPWSSVRLLYVCIQKYFVNWTVDVQ